MKAIPVSFEARRAGRAQNGGRVENSVVPSSLNDCFYLTWSADRLPLRQTVPLPLSEF
jgi:hypothetical protein